MGNAWRQQNTSLAKFSRSLNFVRQTLVRLIFFGKVRPRNFKRRDLRYDNIVERPEKHHEFILPSIVTSAKHV